MKGDADIPVEQDLFDALTERCFVDALKDILRQAYQSGRRSILDGICSGTSLDDAYSEAEIAVIVQEAVQKLDEMRDVNISVEQDLLTFSDG